MCTMEKNIVYLHFVTLEPEGIMSTFWQNEVNTAVKNFILKDINPKSTISQNDLQVARNVMNLYRLYEV